MDTVPRRMDPKTSIVPKIEAHLDSSHRALVDQLAADLQSRVLSGDLPSGTRLRQESLAEEFGVSRTPVREALRKLQASGLVELRPNRGAFVRGLSPSEIRDAYEVRAELEGLAAELAALHVTHEQIDLLHDAQSQFRIALDRTVDAREQGLEPSEEEILRWGRTNDTFHQEIQQAAGNHVLQSVLGHLHRSIPRDLSRLVLRESTTLLEENVDEHEGILGAIERRDPVAARDLMAKHVRRAGLLVTRRFEGR
jgi:DNA-binding GntR family transcriptional regulator